MDELEIDDPTSTISSVSTDKFPLTVEPDQRSQKRTPKDEVDAIRSRVQDLEAGIRQLRIGLENRQAKSAHSGLACNAPQHSPTMSEPASKGRKKSLHSMGAEQFFSHFLPPAPPASQVSNRASTAGADVVARRTELEKSAALEHEHKSGSDNSTTDRLCSVSAGHPPGTTDYILPATTFEGFSRAKQRVRSSDEELKLSGNTLQTRGAKHTPLFAREALALSSDSDTDANTEDEEEAYADACLRGGGGETPQDDPESDAVELSEEEIARLVRSAFGRSMNASPTHVQSDAHGMARGHHRDDDSVESSRRSRG